MILASWSPRLGAILAVVACYGMPSDAFGSEDCYVLELLVDQT